MLKRTLLLARSDMHSDETPARRAFEEIETKLRDSDRRLNAVLNNATVSIFLVNEVQHCVYMNAAAERLTGYMLEETLGRPLHDVIHHTRPDGSNFPIDQCAIDRAFPEKAGTQGEEVLVHKNGNFYPVAFTASPVHDDEANVIGTIIEVRDISEEKRNEEARILLMREVDHRARNVMAVVQSLTKLTKADDLESFREILMGRINALARAQTSLAVRRWENGCLTDVVKDELEALCLKEQVTCCGPNVPLQPDQVQPLSMLFHELATNATKHGSCSQKSGKLSVSWTYADEQVVLQWREVGGPGVMVPSGDGFGSKLVQTLVRQMGGTISLDWFESGLAVDLSFPVKPRRIVA